MSFFDKLRESARQMMAGRHGADELSMALMIVGLTISIVSSLLGVGIFSEISLSLTRIL